MERTLLAAWFAAALMANSDLGAQAPTDPPPTIAITGVTVVDVRAGGLLPAHTVLIENGRISRVAAADSVTVPSGAILVDGTGRFLIPGLIDMHAHPQPRDLQLYVAAGVTTLRVMLGNRQFLRMREQLRRGELLGPSLVVGGPIVESPPPPGYDAIVTTNRRYVTTADEGAREVETQRAAGFEFIKIYNHLSADAFHGIMRAAREHGMDVVGHVPFAVGIEGALAAGMRTIEHGRGYLHMVVPPEVNAAMGLDLHSRILAWRHADTLKIPEIARLTAAAGVWNCPTLVVDRMLWPSQRMMTYLAGRYAPLLIRPQRQTLMDRSRIQWASNFSEDDFRAADHAYAVKSRIVRALRDAGAPLCAGSDAWPPAGFSMHDELRLLVEAGLTPLESLQAATSSAARAMRRDDLGEVAEGRRADLVLLDANILEGIDAIAHPRGVMLGGRWLPKETLDSLVEDAVASHRETIVTAAGGSPPAGSTMDVRALHGGDGASLSPDGRTVFFLSGDSREHRLIHWPLGAGERSIFVTTPLMAMPRVGGRARVVATGVTADAFDRAYDLSPDGRSIVYAGFADDSTPALLRVSAAGGVPDVLHRFETAGIVMPRWSPDGRAIAFAVRDGLFVLPAAGGAARRLTSIPAWGAEVQWSPHGRDVVAIGGGTRNGPNTLYVVSVAAGEARRATPESEDVHYKEGIRWHPDGRRISFMCYCGDGEVRIASLDGAPSTRLVDIPGQWDWYGAWSRDGGTFFFLSYGERSGLFALDLKTGTARFLADAEELPVWSADGSVMAWSVSGNTQPF